MIKPPNVSDISKAARHLGRAAAFLLQYFAAVFCRNVIAYTSRDLQQLTARSTHWSGMQPG
ncbi:MAG TPA: hypothetical protein VGM52_05015, partial [Herbaspirillum sp.]